MKLSDKLKSIFTSGDSYTVLQLLNKLIKEVEDYEVEQTGVFVHTITIDFSGHPLTINVINTNPENNMSISDVIDTLAGGQVIKLALTSGVETLYCVEKGSFNTLICNVVNLVSGVGTSYLALSITSQSVKEI